MNRTPTSDPNSDVLAQSRETLLKAHIIHDFNMERVRANLIGCYGIIMAHVYRRMLRFVCGSRLIDCGCGFGQFARVAIDAGYQVHAVDIDDNSLELARQLSGIPCRKESVYATSLPDNSCDTAVCCDSVQHFDLRQLAPELGRLGVQRIIIYDSNLQNRFLKYHRAATGHEERNDLSVNDIVRELTQLGYSAMLLRYENYLSLPLSGGFQQAPFSLANRFPRAVYSLDQMLAPVVRTIGLEHQFAFRFLLIFDRASGTSVKDATPSGSPSKV
ncbi:MAG: class I SAM-dependent methyltransferase [Acidobacteriaceae bacterium]|nr:class I SAM-dependent methyltransferase [Acidobacteriaceae bacterium]